MSRSRRPLSIALLVIGLVCLLGSVATLYVKDRVLDGDAFADEVVRTVDDPAVARLLSERITNKVIDRAAPDLVTLKPIVESAVTALIETSAVRDLLQKGVLVAHNAVLDNEADNAIVRLANVGGLVKDAVQRVSPEVAQKIPTDLDTRVVRFADQPVLVDITQAVDKIDRFAGILPAVTLALFASSIAVAPRRRRAAVNLGLALLGLALTAAVALAAIRLAALARLEPGDNRDAGAAVWSSFLGGLTDWFLWIGAGGILLATVAATIGFAGGLLEPLQRGWSRVSRVPAEGRSRGAWAAGLAVLGLLIILASGLVIRLLVVGAGIYLIARAISLVISHLAESRGWDLSPERLEGEAPEAVISRRGAIIAVAAIVAVAVAVGVGMSLALKPAEDSVAAQPTAGPGCNGSEKLCDRTLEKTSFFATHNSYAGAGYPGFLFAEQEGTITTQLEAGVRGLWIDTYYGTPGGRRVYTRTDLINPALNAQLEETVGPLAEQAAARLRDGIARPPADAPAEIYLCHGFCELGAVPAEEAFGEIKRFLEANPREVLIIDLEDYTTPKDTVALLERTGLADLVYKGPTGPPWPTLDEMATDGGQILLVVEHRTKGAPKWYRPAYEQILQETPFKFKTPQEMSCAPGRGSAGNSLFLINNWIDTDPAPRASNARVVNAYDFLTRRARRCETERGLFPNILNVDFYREGDTLGVTDSLNGLPRP